MLKSFKHVNEWMCVHVHFLTNLWFVQQTDQHTERSEIVHYIIWVFLYVFLLQDIY